MFNKLRHLILILLLFSQFLRSNTQAFTEIPETNFSQLSYAAAACADYNLDGYMDILLTGLKDTVPVTELYLNQGEAGFIHQTEIHFTGVMHASVDWGDFDNDGDPDIIISGSTNNDIITRIYRNNGDKTFSELNDAKLQGVKNGSVVWGDCDNDGDLDILITGESDSTYITRIYINENSGFSELAGTNLPGVKESAAIWGDLDNDSYLDIVLTGNTGTERIAKIYRNNGNMSFTEIEDNNLTAVSNGSLDLGDYDQDGDLDLVLTGNTANLRISKIYRNDEISGFTEQDINLTGIHNGTAIWGDYDNDSYLDILLTGYTGGDAGYSIYRNNGDNTFTELIGTWAIATLRKSIATWIDHDNDGDLDAFMTRHREDYYENALFLNEVSQKSELPSAPEGMSYSIKGAHVVLSWKRLENDTTRLFNVSYNLRIGKTAGGREILSPHASADGNRTIVEIGNAQQDTAYYLRIKESGTYYWAVQAINNSFKGGVFTPEQTFTFSNDVPASGIYFSDTASTSVVLNWTRGTGNQCVVFAKETGDDEPAEPVNGHSYHADRTYGKGSQIGNTGWHCVYKGLLDTTTVLGLKAKTSYSFHVIEFVGEEGNETYNTSGASGNPKSITTFLFSPLEIELPRFSSVEWADIDSDQDIDILTLYPYGSNYNVFLNTSNGNFNGVDEPTINSELFYKIDFGDYDKDGDADILKTEFVNINPGGYFVTEIFRNDSGTAFTQLDIPDLNKEWGSSSHWGDYDNDGDLDILFFAPPSVYRNDGNNNFTKLDNLTFKDTNNGMADWIDYDNDGKLDIMLSGKTEDEYISTLFQNNDSIFSEVESSFTGLRHSSFAWGDYDNDQLQDLILIGQDYSQKPRTLLYRNTGNGEFVLTDNSGLPDIMDGSVAWGDYDLDTYVDLLITGNTGSEKITGIYKNNKDGTFSRFIDQPLHGVSGSRVDWCDFDNDGDLDFSFSGYNDNGHINRIYRNDLATPNSPPSVPEQLKSYYDSSSIVFSWNESEDDLSPGSAITYNLKLGTTLSGSEIISPMAADNGFLFVKRKGNTGSLKSYTLPILPEGKYYWSVQAIDHSYMASPFTEVDSFEVDLSTLNTIHNSSYNQGKEYKVYPNPSVNDVNILIPDKEARCKIYSLHGKLIHHSLLMEGVNTLSLSDIPPGLYNIEISTHEHTVRKLFIRISNK